MAVYTVTTSNWNSAAFWAGVDEGSFGQALDFSALPAGFSVSFDAGAHTATISDGSASFVIGDAGSAGPVDARLGGTTSWEYFDRLDLGAGDDVAHGGDGYDSIHGDDGTDLLSGGAGNDLIDGGADADTIGLSDPFGYDTIIGGEGATTGSDFDTLDMSGTGTGIEVTFSGGEAGWATDGNGTATFSQIEALKLTDQDDSVDGTASDAAMAVDALGGADSVIGSMAADMLRGGDGNDTLRGAAGDDEIIGGAGDDSLFGNEGGDTIIAGDGNDSAYGEFGDDYIEGGAGDDHLEGNEGADTVYGGDGNDWIRGSYGDDEIWGGAGDDYLWGGYNDDTFHVENGFGNDTIDAEAVDEANGDTLDLSLVTDDLTIDLTGSNPEAGTFSDGISTASFDDIENIVLGGGRDTIRLADLGGADRVFAFDMADMGDGTTKDRLDVSGLTSDGGTTPLNSGDVTVTDDGSGNAVLSFPGGESITLMGVAPAALGSAAVLESIGIPGPAPVLDHIVEGTAGDDLIDGAYTGDAQGDMIDNGDAADGSDDDYVRAGAGDDSIDAGAGDDTVLGEGGDDEFFLDGTLDNDSIVGGDSGETLGDRINFSAIADDITVTFTAPGAGTISDGAHSTTFSGIERFQMGTGNDSVIGSEGAESIIGNHGDDTILGGGGGDTIYSGFGDDSVSGGAGDDVLWTSGGADTVAGGAGDDQIDVGAGDGEADLVILADGDDHDVISGFEAPTDNGDGTWSGNDRLDVSALTDASGNQVSAEDVAVSDSNGDGTGNAILSFPDGTSVELPGVAVSAVQSLGQLVAMGIPAPAGDFIVEGTGGSDLIDAGYAGDPEGDRIDNNDHSDGSDDDDIRAGDGTDTVLAGDGDDTVSGGGGDDRIEGGAGADLIHAEEGDDTILGGDGNDTIYGFEGGDLADGGAGDDLINTRTSPGTGMPDRGYPGAYAGDADPDNDRDTVFGGDGNDTLLTGDDGDSIDGGAGADSIDAGFDDDTVLGGDGDDTILANEGSDLVDGGQGDDLIHGDGTDTLTGPLNIDDASDLAPDNGRDTLSGGDGNDTIFGMDDADLIHGDAGNDLLDGGLDDDTIHGDSGDDTMLGGAGDDLFVFADGDGADSVSGGEAGETAGDMLDFEAVTGNMDIAFSGDGAGDAAYGADSVRFAGIERLILGGGNDSADASAAGAAMAIDAGAGADTLLGGLGGDTLAGDAGNDSLIGGEGVDALYGGAGDDTIVAGEGDIADGGDGDDLFLIADYGEAGAGNATILGGEGGEVLGDTLDFRGLTRWKDVTYSNSDPGAGGGLSGHATLADGSVVTFSEIENVIICFTAGTRIATAQGLREVQELRPGDLVATRDHGLQPVRWAGQRKVPALGNLAPVRFAAGSIGNARALLVSPQHRMLLQGPRAALFFGHREVLASAKHLVNGGSIAPMPGGEVTYVHILFDRHEIVYAEGAASESFFPGDAGLDAVEMAAREELFTIFPELRSSAGGFTETARFCLRAHESRLLRPE